MTDPAVMSACTCAHPALGHVTGRGENEDGRPSGGYVLGGCRSCDCERYSPAGPDDPWQCGNCGHVNAGDVEWCERCATSPGPAAGGTPTRAAAEGTGLTLRLHSKTLTFAPCPVRAEQTCAMCHEHVNADQAALVTITREPEGTRALGAIVCGQCIAAALAVRATAELSPLGRAQVYTGMDPPDA